MVDALAMSEWGRVTPLERWPSRCLPEHASARRNDPFHGRDIGNLPGDQWTDQQGLWRYLDTGAVRAPAECRLGREEALRKFAAGDRIPALGVVEMHRVVSPAQVACVLGTSVSWAARSLRLAYAAGLVQGDLTRPRGADRFTDLYRPHHPSSGRREDPVTERFWESLPPADYAGVFGGRPRRREAISDRHAHLTAELLLRVAEHTSTACVLGEMYTRHYDLFGPDIGLKSPGRRGDGLIIRADGLHIVVETTASVSRLHREPDGKARFSVSDKVRAWAESMLAGGRACSDVVVLFVDAARPDSGDATRNWQRLRQAMRNELSGRRYAAAGIPARFFAQRWVSWFPAAHAASEAFGRLSALSPVGRIGDERWVRRNLLDPGDVPSEVTGADRAAVTRNAALLFGVPYWMRPDPAAAPDLEELAILDMGFDTVPVLPRVSSARQRADGGMWPAPVPLRASRDVRQRPLCARRAPYRSCSSLSRATSKTA